MCKRQPASQPSTRQLPKGRVDVVDASRLTRVDVVDGEVDAEVDAKLTDDDMRTACLMLASGGLTPQDIAAALKVHQRQVTAWLGRREYRRAD